MTTTTPVQSEAFWNSLSLPARAWVRNRSAGMPYDYAIHVAISCLAENARSGSEDTAPTKMLREVARQATIYGLVPMPNLPALRKTYDWVSAPLGTEEILWYQPVWRVGELHDADLAEIEDIEAWAEANNVDIRDCKTAMCFAGKATDDAGVHWEGSGDTIPGDDHVVALLADRLTPEQLDDLREYGTDVERFAIPYLGLTDPEASALFHGENRVDNITRVLTEVFARAGERL
jgi:hypothetical protein